MPQMVERDRQVNDLLNNPKLAPPGAMFKEVEGGKSLFQVTDAQSIKTIDKSNAMVGKRIMTGLKNCMMLSKRMYGRVGTFGTVFTGLRKMLGGI
ncbi:MAG: hypothetical protein KKD39_00100 [Candidatus Altiarchaeota archaeon]|nr:hypothetical protein [Candidatus Altiarchaeota archaeon]